MSRVLQRVFALAVAAAVALALWYSALLPSAVCGIAGVIAYFTTNYWLWVKSKRIRAARVI